MKRMLFNLMLALGLAAVGTTTANAQSVLRISGDSRRIADGAATQVLEGRLLPRAGDRHEGRVDAG